MIKKKAGRRIGDRYNGPSAPMRQIEMMAYRSQTICQAYMIPQMAKVPPDGVISVSYFWERLKKPVPVNKPGKETENILQYMWTLISTFSHIKNVLKSKH